MASWTDTSLAWLGVAFFGYLAIGTALFNAVLFWRHVVLDDKRCSYVFALGCVGSLGLCVFGPFACGSTLTLTLAMTSAALDGLPLSLLEDGADRIKHRAAR